MIPRLAVFDEIHDSNLGTAFIDYPRNQDGSIANSHTTFGKKSRNLRMDRISVGGPPTFTEPSIPALQTPGSPARTQPLSTAKGREAAESRSSDDGPPQRPDPNAVQHQQQQPSHPTPVPEQSHQAPAPSIVDHSRLAAQVPVLAPIYQVGVILAKEAETHLEQRKAAIGCALQKTDKNITADHWIAQLGFMRGRAPFVNVMEGRRYERDAQVILIKVFDPWMFSERSWKKLVDRLSKEIVFYGLLTWGSKVQLLTPTCVPPVKKLQGIFQEGCGTTESGSFTPSNTRLPFCIRTSNHGDPEGPLSLETDQEFKKETKADGSISIEFKKLALKGPAGYKLSNLRVFITSPDCYFNEIAPKHRGGGDNGDKITQSVTDTQKESATTNIEVEVSTKSGAKAKAGSSSTNGNEVAVGTQSTCNALLIHQISSEQEVVIKYIPTNFSHPSDRRTLVLQEGEGDEKGDLPRVTAYPAGEGSRLRALRISTLSKWVLDEEKYRARKLGLVEQFWRRMTGSREKAPTSYRKHSEVLFCTEVTFPKGNVARAADPVVCNLAQDF